MRQNKKGSHTFEPKKSNHLHFIYFFVILLAILVGIYFICYANRIIFYDYTY